MRMHYCSFSKEGELQLICPSSEQFGKKVLWLETCHFCSTNTWAQPSTGYQKGVRFPSEKIFKKSLPSKRCLCFLYFLVIIDHWWQYSACICVESNLKFLVWIADNFIWLWFSASPSSSPYLHIFPLWFYRFPYFIPLSHVFSRLKIHGLLSLLFEWNWFHN